MSGLIKARTAADLGAMEMAEPEIQTHPSPQVADAADDWLCAWCFHRAASEKDRFAYAGKNEFSFQNPEGIRFHIFIFARTIGCCQVGIPTFEHTWFPGHAWSYCLCGGCRTHLGWFYTGPSAFAGLIRDRIVRASWVMN